MIYKCGFPSFASVSHFVGTRWWKIYIEKLSVCSWLCESVTTNEIIIGAIKRETTFTSNFSTNKGFVVDESAQVCEVKGESFFDVLKGGWSTQR